MCAEKVALVNSPGVQRLNHAWLSRLATFNRFFFDGMCRDTAYSYKRNYTTLFFILTIWCEAACSWLEFGTSDTNFLQMYQYQSSCNIIIPIDDVEVPLGSIFFLAVGPADEGSARSPSLWKALITFNVPTEAPISST